MVEELLKAQSTHMSLWRQYEEARQSEMTLAQREVREGGGREGGREGEGGGREGERGREEGRREGERD